MLLTRADWQAREVTHAERADAITADWRARVRSGQKHPIEDFLFTYYPVKPTHLRRWHPGAGVALEDAGDFERTAWRWYRTDAIGSVSVDAAAFLAAKKASVDFIEKLLTRTAARVGQFGCFGLHEWAMVYRRGDHRHDVPLRLGQSGTDEVVESHRIGCSHFDAFRFFTPEAVPLNRLSPTRDNQPELEQPGCLHAGMDVYKWAIKLGPLVPGELLLDAFDLARDIRWLDMRASPYDVLEWAGEPVAIETPEGKAEYVRQQRAFADRSNALRSRVVDAIRDARTVALTG
ncbi:3-methyladenine DNA glycosylase [Mycetocola zhadangensis]|uniref:3-methyladenine DNA glycosylase n=1 Tax=Mycetocola zhadangensis TaxID=1164595 RepID=A0A3L7J268_9MICO|nr:3-methyladenine DNA glycosylase [Mycetocola zhadangensis]RLQ84647.1 3-methyladenine DNA glycosylase [Mycetocola zhadangensis]